MKEKLDLLQEILYGSKEYEFKGSILKIIGYYTGKRIKLDLSVIDEEMLSKLVVDDCEKEKEIENVEY